ncbi:hypothetical protein OS493_028265 [Desmophyllum pertusum]|uniref:Uncharacterized protein n=1 Tax=Desmophyllum pertusum TaxID=174260 RepID=A0A9W9YKE0_9CNID|nr:hypothetical protein OS493_028265 [Desmophyllum pertusum]
MLLKGSLAAYDLHKQKCRRQGRKREKLTRRTVALEKVKKWDKNLKGKVAEVLTDEYMSSEESSIEDDSAVYVIKTIPWESSQLKKRKRKLDKAYEKSSGKRSKQRSVKRVRKDEIIIFIT